MGPRNTLPLVNEEILFDVPCDLTKYELNIHEQPYTRHHRLIVKVVEAEQKIIAYNVSQSK